MTDTPSTSQPDPSQPKPTILQKSLKTSKAGFDKLWAAADKLGDPVNKLSNKIGSEAFWPTTLDRESDKAARILRSFCKDGFYGDDQVSKAESKDEVKGKQRVLKKIPAEVIKEAKGLAIFTTMRSGLWVSGAGGSGVVVARKEDGSWSEPSGIMLHTAGLGWMFGVDIYDCVLVLRTQSALDAFRHTRWTVGGELSAVAGPVGVGGYVETELHKRRAPIFTYMKSRGFYAGVGGNGTVIIERTDENERFYGTRITCTDIFAGKAVHAPVRQLRMIKETLKAAEGSAADESALPTGKPPADHEVEESGHIFGVPDPEDPDPFGVHALEKEGLKVNDAATHEPAPEEEFEFHPSEDSPAYTAFHRTSRDESEHDTPKTPRRVPPVWEGPRFVAPIDDEARPRTSSSSDRGTQTDDYASTVPTPAMQEPEPSLNAKKPPPALPPRTPAQVQPIQMEDNEEGEENDEAPSVPPEVEADKPITNGSAGSLSATPVTDGTVEESSGLKEDNASADPTLLLSRPNSHQTEPLTTEEKQEKSTSQAPESMQKPMPGGFD